MVKNLPANVGDATQVRSLCWEDPLEKERATRSNILAWKSPWTEEPGGLQSMGSQRARHERVVNMHIHTQIQLRAFWSSASKDGWAVSTQCENLIFSIP